VLGKHLQAGPGGEDIGAYLFQRTVPREHLGAAAAAALLGVWRDKIVVSQAPLPRDFIRVLLDAEAGGVFRTCTRPTLKRRKTQIGPFARAEGRG